MQSPEIEKIVLNSGVGQGINNPKLLDDTVSILQKIALSQKANKTKARVSVPAFSKLRTGMLIGAKVTLRKQRAFSFLFNLINLALPRISNFQGFSSKKFDKFGNYSFGLDNLNIFPEVPYNLTFKNQGVSITIVFKNKKRRIEENKFFLRLLDFPFND